MISKVIVPLAVIAANGAALLTQLMVPRFLEPAEYTLFSVYWAAALFFSSFIFEWMRYGVLRYSHAEDDLQQARVRRSTLIYTYRGVALALSLVAVFCFFMRLIDPLFLSLACVVFYALCQGSFEGYQAWQRASGSNFGYGVSAIIRAVLSMLGALGFAYYFRAGPATLFGMALAFPLALIGPLCRGVNLVHDVALERKSLIFLARFGVFAAAGSILSAAFPTVFRSVAADRLGLNEAAGLVLVADLSLKVVGVLGLAFNILLLQRTFKAADSGSTDIIANAVSQQIALPCGVILPAAVGFYFLQPFVGEFLAPPLYVEAYFDGLFFSVCAAAVLGIRQYALDPVFLAVGMSRMALIGPLMTSLALPFVAWGAPFFGFYGVKGIALSVLVSALFGLICSMVLISRVMVFRWPWKDLLVIALGCGVISSLFVFFPAPSSFWGVGCLVFLSILSYFLVCIIGDLLGARRLLRYFSR